MRCITKQTKEDALKLLESDFSVLPKEFEERKTNIKYFLDNFKKVERICMFTSHPYDGLELFAKNNKLKLSSTIVQFIKSKLERYEVIDIYRCKEDGEYYIQAQGWGISYSDTYYMDKIELLGVDKDKIIDIGKLKSYSKSGLEEAVWLYLIAYDLENLTMLEFMKGTFLEHSSGSRLKYHYKKIFQQEGLSNVYTLISLLSKNNHFVTNDWFTEYYANKKLGHNNTSKMIVTKSFRSSVEYVEDFVFEVVSRGGETNTPYTFVGMVDMQSVERFNSSIKHVESILREMGKSETFYVSDIQDTYVFIYKNKVISLPYDLREKKDSPLVKNQINIAEGYVNCFYKIEKTEKDSTLEVMNKYVDIGISVSGFKGYCERKGLNYRHFKAVYKKRGLKGVLYTFEYKGVDTVKVYDTQEFYELGIVSYASFRGACLRNGWDVNEFEIIPLGDNKHKCIPLPKCKNGSIDLFEETLFTSIEFKEVCFKQGWDIKEFEFIRQDTQQTPNLQSGYYIHKSRLTNNRRIELEIKRLRKIEEKYNNILENILKNS